jgi:coenzyme F420-0:L-glutamate ligase/coenzyme F420-1:gamma-L-glutamate ligase
MSITILPVRGLPQVKAGDDLAAMLAAALKPMEPKSGDILVVTHKVVSKSEGALAEARSDADYRRIVEDEAQTIIRRRGDLVIAITHHGFVCANAGVDRSNVVGDNVVLLPKHPDRSARRLRARLERALGIDLAVIITDTFGRPWRTGLVDVAIGISGMKPILDLRGTSDMNGQMLEVTEVAIADEVAAAAELAIGKSTGTAAALVRGVEFQRGEGRISELVRPVDEDMFR